jgi:hypothetical protein
MHGRLSFAAVLLGVGLIGSDAEAQTPTPEDRTQALAEVREGNRLLDLGDAPGALGRFETALGLVKSPKLHFNFGQALAAIPRREADAHEEFTKYLEEVPDASPETRAEATRQLLLLRGKVGLITISSRPEGAEVSIDGQATGVTPLPRPLALLPGAHDVRVAKPGFASASEAMTLVAGGEWSQDYVLRSSVVGPGLLAARPAESSWAPAQVTLVANPAVPERDGLEKRRKRRVAAGLSAGGGLALGVAGIFSYREGASKLDHIMQAEASGARYNESDGNYKAWGDAGLALMITGGVVVASAALLYWLNRTNEMR